MSKPRKTTSARTASPAIVRHIARQVQRMSDAEVYALTFSGDRTVRRLANQIAHKRAEAYAIGADR